VVKAKPTTTHTAAVDTCPLVCSLCQ